MNSQRTYGRLPVNFVALFALTIASNAVYGTFLPVYLHNIGFSDTLVGTLLAIGPFVAFPAQPFWGIAGDRARSKNTVLRVMLAGSAAVALLYPLFRNFYYLFTAITAFTFFNISMLPMQDAITLEAIEGSGWRYGTIRMAGTIGYAVMSIAAGLLSGWNIHIIFPLYSAVMLAAFLMTYRVPVVVGHQIGGPRVSPFKVLKNRKIVLLLAFTFVLSISLGYYNSFFSIFYSHMGASNFLVGVSMFCSSSAEIPFLLFSNRIIRRFGVRKTLVASGAVMGVRWLLLFLVSNIYVVPFINMLHGCSYIVLMYCMVTFINEEVPMELRASGQTLYALVTQGVARIIGSILGGAAGDAMGVKTVFIFCFAINLAAVAVFSGLFLLERKRSGPPALR